MPVNIGDVFKDFLSGLQVARLYPQWHPEFKKAIDKAYLSLQETFKERNSLILAIVGEELTFQKDIFFDLSKIEKPLILYLKDRGIERIEFFVGMQKEELSRLISLLATPKEQIKQQPQDLLSVLGVKNIIVGKIKVSSSMPLDAEKEKLINYLALYEDSVTKATQSMDDLLEEREVDHFALRLNLVNVMENLAGRHQEFLNLGVMKRYDTRTYYHTLNVSILAMYFSAKMGFAREEVLDIGIAGLFHDIGKIYISRKIIQKPSRLTDEEFAKMKNHVIVGTEILLKYVEAVGFLPVVTCFEHHLKYDMSGYPKLTFAQPPHLASEITCICDVYDALSQRRSYKDDYPPSRIYEVMLKEKGTTFEPELLGKFFRIMGVWPVGAIVSLTDARIAVVREENEDDIFSPKVEVIMPIDKKESIDLRTTRGTNKIEWYLNPFNEGKEYLHLV